MESDQNLITQTLLRYFRALDEKDYALLDTVFLPGAICIYDMGKPNQSTYPEMVETFREFLKPFYWTQHMAGHPVLDVDGDSARARMPLRALHVQKKRDGSTNRWWVHGVYHDELLKAHGDWRIQRRHFRAVDFQGEVLPRDQVQCFDELPWKNPVTPEGD